MCIRLRLLFFPFLFLVSGSEGSARVYYVGRGEIKNETTTGDDDDD